MARITISYRRDDSDVITGRIFDRLSAHYGRETVFRDIDSIPLGVDFRKHVNSVLDDTDIMVAVVGPKWIGPRPGQSRLDNAADPVRVEIDAALRKKVPLIPVLVLRAQMPRADQLPPSLEDFAYRNAATIDAGQDFDTHMARLIRAIDNLLVERAKSLAPETAAAVSSTAEASPAPTTSPTEDEERQRFAEQLKREEEERQRRLEEDREREAAEARRREEEDRQQQLAEQRRLQEERDRLAAEQREREEKERQATAQPQTAPASSLATTKAARLEGKHKVAIGAGVGGLVVVAIVAILVAVHPSPTPTPTPAPAPAPSPAPSPAATPAPSSQSFAGIMEPGQMWNLSFSDQKNTQYAGQLVIDKTASYNSFTGHIHVSFNEHGEDTKDIREDALITVNENKITIACSNVEYLTGSGTHPADYFDFTIKSRTEADGVSVDDKDVKSRATIRRN